MTPKAKKVLKKTISIICTIVILVMIALVLFLSFSNASGKVAFIGKYAFVRIISPSMEPTIPTGSYILVEKVTSQDISSLQVGDVIMFYSHDPTIDGKLNTHRILSITPGAGGTEFVTKGDNNGAPDALKTTPDDITGKYIKNLPALTGIAAVFKNKIVYFFLILIPAVVLVAICILDVIRKSKEVKMDILVQKKVEQMKREQSNEAKPKHENTNQEE